MERIRSLSESNLRFFSGFNDLAVIALLPVVVLGYPLRLKRGGERCFRARDLWLRE